MKKQILLLALLTPFFLHSQDCPDPIVEKFEKVTNLAFAEDYSDCPVSMVGYFVSNEFPAGYLKPRKIRKDFVFRCSNGKHEPSSSVPMTLDDFGKYFVISKDRAEPFFEMEKGTKIEFTGKNYIHKVYGKPLGSYFVIDDFVVLE